MNHLSELTKWGKDVLKTSKLTPVEEEIAARIFFRADNSIPCSEQIRKEAMNILVAWFAPITNDAYAHPHELRWNIMNSMPDMVNLAIEADLTPEDVAVVMLKVLDPLMMENTHERYDDSHLMITREICTGEEQPFFHGRVASTNPELSRFFAYLQIALSDRVIGTDGSVIERNNNLSNVPFAQLFIKAMEVYFTNTEVQINTIPVDLHQHILTMNTAYGNPLAIPA